MNSDQTTNVANGWYEAAQERQFSVDGYHAIRQPVRDFVPVDAAVGIAYRDEAPVVIASIPGRLLCISVRPGKEGEDDYVSELTSLPLDAGVQVSVTSTLESTGGSHFRVRRWTLQVLGLHYWELVTRTPTANSLASDHGGEDVINAALAQLGWTVPQ